jgi:putative membrane protein
MNAKLAVSALCIAAMASLAVAQDQPTPAVPTVHGTVSNPRDNALPPDAATLNQADRTFIANAAVGGMFEVVSSQVATTASQDQAIQSFAQQMIQDHTAANQQLQQLAASKHVPVPATLDAKHAQMLNNLRGKQGEQFDAAYVRAQLRAHREAVDLFQKASTGAQDPEVKQFAATTLPKLQHHLQMAQQLPGADKAKAGKQGKKGKKGNKNNNNNAGAGAGASTSGAMNE